MTESKLITALVIVANDCLRAYHVNIITIATYPIHFLISAAACGSLQPSNETPLHQKNLELHLGGKNKQTP